MQLYNTLGRKKQEFVPLVPGKVGIYSCGPTVYNAVHIGNLSCFLTADLLKRWLIYRGYEVTHVMNLTDVDDKTIKGSREAGESLEVYTERYAQIFFADLKRIGVMFATYYPRATENIPEMIELIKNLIIKGHAYVKDGSVYYRISTFPSYGDLAQLNTTGQQSTERVLSDDHEKEDARDFALWKAYNPDTDGDVYWDAEWGKGRPGWHIECSAMSMKLLGDTFDIHTGAVDLIFPHHTNEIAQSEGVTGVKFVNYWSHRAFLTIGDDKMSKSLDNFMTLSEIAKTPFDQIAFRYMVLSVHYRSKLVYTADTLKAAKQTVTRLRRLYHRLLGVSLTGEDYFTEIIPDIRHRFEEAMDDDLNSPRALAVLFELVNIVEGKLAEGSMSKKSTENVLAFLRDIDRIFGVIQGEISADNYLDENQLALLKKRAQARLDKNWQLADEIRDDLLAQGIKVEDTKNEQKCFFV